MSLGEPVQGGLQAGVKELCSLSSYRSCHNPQPPQPQPPCELDATPECWFDCDAAQRVCNIKIDVE